MKRGDIYRVCLNPVLGQEQRGTARPILVMEEVLARIVTLFDPSAPD